jgi:hypothetical protein
MAGAAGDHTQVALAFTKALAARDYEAAYALTSRAYREGTSLKAMADAFEAIVPLDWGTVAPVDVGVTMDDWPGREPSDAGWVYVSVGGDVYSEAVTVVVTREDGELRVRTVEFGRP